MAQRKYKPVKLRKWKVLKVAVRKGKPGLAMRALGFHKLPRTLRRLYTPQTTTARMALRRAKKK